MASATGETTYYLGIAGRTVGPLDTRRVLDAIAAGEVPPDAEVCVVGGAAWSSILEVEPFASALASGARPAAPARPVARVDAPAPARPALPVSGTFTPIPKGLPSIGPATLTALASRDVRTAYDVLCFASRGREPGEDAEIPGVGPARLAVLVEWATRQRPDLDRSLDELRGRAREAAREVEQTTVAATTTLAQHMRDESIRPFIDAEQTKRLLDLAPMALSGVKTAAACAEDSGGWDDVRKCTLSAEEFVRSTKELVSAMQDVPERAREVADVLRNRREAERAQLVDGVKHLLGRGLLLLISAALFVFILYLINPEAMGRRLGLGP